MSLLAAIALVAGFQGIAAPIEVPFKIGEDAIIVDVVVNGRKLSLMFDTGFGGAVVVGPGVNLGKATGHITLRDFVGQIDAETTKITSFKLGPLDLDASDLEAVRDPSDGEYSQTYNVHCDGILGLEALTKYIVEINVEKNRLILHPRSHDISKRTPDGKRTFLAKLLPTGHNALELEVLTRAGKKIVMALDTGNAFFAATHKDVLERVGLWPTGTTPKFMSASFVASGQVSSWNKRMRDVSIFGVAVADSTWSVIDAASGSAESDGTIGFGFLKNFNTTIDYERRRVWLENFTGKTGNEPTAEIGVSAAVDPSSKRARVVFVAPDSPADKAGIKRGDTILSIDGNDELNLGYRKLNKLFDGEFGSTVKLTLSRNGNLMRVEAKRAFMVNE